MIGYKGASIESSLTRKNRLFEMTKVSFRTSFSPQSPPSQFSLTPKMRGIRAIFFLRRCNFSFQPRRSFATRYTARVVREERDGKRFAIEVETPNIIVDVKGYPYPRRDIICKLSNLLQTSQDWVLDVQDYIESLGLVLSTSEVSEVLKAQNNPTKAMDFFRFMGSSVHGFKHDCFTYNRILTILGKHEKFDQVVQLRDEMIRLAVPGNISTVNILIGICSGKFENNGELDKCLGLVKIWGLKFNCYTYKSLLQGYLRLRDVEKAFEVYRKMRRCGYRLDIFGYNMLLDALAKDGQVEQAYKIFSDMKCKNCEPDEYTYTVLIRMAGKLGNSDKFLELFHEMISKGCAPNLITYNTMIHALSRNHMVDKAIFLFSKMVKNNCRPNEFTYSKILEVLALEGQLSRLNEVLEISNKYMNKSIYAFLVRTLSKLGHVSEAHKLFCNMWSFDYKGDRAAYISMLENLCNAGKTAEALDFLSMVKEYGLVSDTVMYNTVFAALGKLKQISSIQALYKQMDKDGVVPDIFTYNILISSFGRAGQVDEAFKLFEDMENIDCKPDVITYNSLINCLGKNGDLDEAHMRFKEMQEKGLDPDVITYSTLIECFGKSNRVEMACRLFDEMIEKGCYPNIVTYNILLDCLERSGKIAEALELYERLKQQGLTPDSITYTVLERLRSGSDRAVRMRKQSSIMGWVVSPLR